MNINTSLSSGLNPKTVKPKLPVDDPKSPPAPSNLEQNSKPIPKQAEIESKSENFVSSLVKDTKYESAFGKESLDFSNMTLNEFHQVVKSVMAIDADYTAKYGSDEPQRFSKLGNPLISRKRESLLDLGMTLEILSYGEGDVDPDKKIDVMAYFSDRSTSLIEKAKTQPDIYSTPARHSQELLGTLDKYFSEQAILEHQEQAVQLLEAENQSHIPQNKEPKQSKEPKVDLYI